MSRQRALQSAPTPAEQSHGHRYRVYVSGQRRRVASERPCEVCGRLFAPLVDALKQGKGKTCSISCGHAKAGRAAVLVRTRKFATVWPRPELTLTGRRARRLVARALCDGILIRPAACDSCLCEKSHIDAHHDDYLKPLEVVWLCKGCHKLRHYRGPRVVAPMEAAS